MTKHEDFNSLYAGYMMCGDKLKNVWKNLNKNVKDASVYRTLSMELIKDSTWIILFGVLVTYWLQRLITVYKIIDKRHRISEM